MPKSLCRRVLSVSSKPMPSERFLRLKTRGVTSSGPLSLRPSLRSRSRALSFGIASSEANQKHCQAAPQSGPQEVHKCLILIDPMA